VKVPDRMIEIVRTVSNALEIDSTFTFYGTQMAAA
jgi:hypothetical protein